MKTCTTFLHVIYVAFLCNLCYTTSVNWLVFSYSLPSKSSSSPRVTLWRRLRRLGTISPTGSIYVLPDRDECVEAFQWLSQEIQHSNGQALIMHVEQFDGLEDAQLIALFHEACKEDYAEIEMQVEELQRGLATPEMDAGVRRSAQESLAKLRRQYTNIANIDYFDSPEGLRLSAQLEQVAQTLSPGGVVVPEVKAADIADYTGKRWVTRPQPHVDRLACIWLIRRFIDAEAVIRYAAKPQRDEIAFDMSRAEFAHMGNLCTFETMIRAFGIEAVGLSTLAEIVHDIDLRDEKYFHPEIAGIDALLKGWLLLDLSDTELETRGVALFESLLESLAAQSRP